MTIDSPKSIINTPNKEYILYYVWINDSRPNVKDPYWHYLGWNGDHAVYWTSKECRKALWNESSYKYNPCKDHIKFWSSRDIDEYNKLNGKYNGLCRISAKYSDMLWNLENNGKGYIKFINDDNNNVIPKSYISFIPVN